LHLVGSLYNILLHSDCIFSVPVSLDADDLGTKVHNWIRSGKQESET